MGADTLHPVLSLRDMHVAYGHIDAVRGVELDVLPGELVCLIGANGAGKTTSLGGIAGLLPLKRGSVEFLGESLGAMPAHRRLLKGMALVPEGRGIFGRLTVEENLAMGAYSRRDKREIEADMAQVFEMLPRIKERLSQVAGTLSGGEQQMLALGRALLSRPRLLLLDEPSMGLAPLVVEKIFDVVSKVVKAGTSILLVEQNASLALEFADRGYVMEGGRIAFSGTGEALLKDPRVRSAYLGEEDA